MESVIVSIKPKWLEKIIRGEKTIEVRKSAPKEVPFRAYIYCTKSKEYEITVDEVRSDGKARHHNCKGKVIATFVCDKVDMELVGYVNHEPCYWDLLLDGSCLTKDELMNYGKWKTLYGWHISDLKIYDKPKELSEFIKPCPYGDSPCQVCEFEGLNFQSFLTDIQTILDEFKEIK